MLGGGLVELPEDLVGRVLGDEHPVLILKTHLCAITYTFGYISKRRMHSQMYNVPNIQLYSFITKYLVIFIGIKSDGSPAGGLANEREPFLNF